ncbi:hypothetical protein ACFO0N_12630 [Halobium salinum]|uniref:Uncharacterized protein n=1 Tax=Halobium salinum TaxID=1364940 RepID=A0ABD5PE67_9EURY|nr:hypothetical protein [Halobium salinum]
MTDHADDGRRDRTGAERPNQTFDADEVGASGANEADGGADATPVESYETDDGTVFYESENPLAWVQSSLTVTLQDSA